MDLDSEFGVELEYTSIDIRVVFRTVLCIEAGTAITHRSCTVKSGIVKRVATYTIRISNHNFK